MRNHSAIILMLLTGLAFVACKSQRITYSTDYKMELSEKPTRFASLDPEGKYIFAAEGESKSGLSAPKAMLIDLEKREEVWLKKMKDLGDIESNPDNIQWLWGENKALFYSKNFDFKLSCVDLMTGEEIWNFSDKKRGYATGSFHVAQNDLIILMTPYGLAGYDLKDGAQKWLREDLKADNDFTDFVTNSATSLNYRYLESKNRLLLSVNQNIHWLNPSNGVSEWTVTENIGSVANADVFEGEGVALFYGATDQSLGEALARSNQLVDAAASIAESGLIREDLIGLDLNTGDVMYRNKFITNGNHRVVVRDGYLIVLGVVLNVYDFDSGELKWQSIEEKRIASNNVFKALAGLTGIDLTVKDKGKPEDLIKDNQIYALYPMVLENAAKQNKYALRQYDLETGEIIWSTEIDRKDISGYFGAEGVLVLRGTTGGFVQNPYLAFFDAGTGEMLYEKEVKSATTGRYQVLAAGGRLYFNNRLKGDFYIWDLRTGEEFIHELIATEVVDMRMLNNDLMVAYDRPAKLALHNPADFSLLKQAEIPSYFSDFDYRGDRFFMKEMAGDPPGGLVTMDLEKFTVTGYLLNKQKGSATYYEGNKSGNLIYKDYYLFLADNGKKVIQIDKDELTRFTVD